MIPAVLQEALAKCEALLIERPAALQLVLGSPEEIERAKLKALNAGYTVRHRGSSYWLEEREVYDTSKEGSDCYTWDKSGNKIRVQRVIMAKDAEGNLRLDRSLGFVWRDYVTFYDN